MHSSLKYLSILASTAASVPFSSLEKRNVCDWKDAEPILYHQYENDVCPPHLQMKLPERVCPTEKQHTSFFGGNACAGYCEVRTNYFYGRESIFLANPYCHGFGQKGATCSISDTETTTAAINFNIPVAIKFADALTAGISGGYTKTWSQAIAQTRSITLSEGECGYWTFLPIIKETCGTYSEGKYLDGCENGKEPVTTTENACVSQGNKAPDTNSTPRGDTIFVRTDCSNRQPLPMDQQDPAYNHDGVPLDRESYDAFANIFEDDSVGALSGKSDIQCDVGETAPLADDCSHAMLSAQQFPALGSLIGHAGKQWWAGYVQTCALQIEYDMDWDEGCQVSLAEVLKAATGIYNKCRVNDKVGGIRQLRDDGKCNAKLRVAATEARMPPQGE